jgi:hypothetical protein
MATTAVQPSPETPLPSQSSAAALVSGDVSALPMVALHLAGRAAIIAGGMAVLAGERDPRRLIGGALAGSAAIELFVLIHELLNRPPVPAAR